MCNYLNWGFISVLAFFLAFIGGCGGSASGGIKIFRLVIFLKSIRNYFSSLLNPSESDRVKDSLLPSILRGHDVKHNYALLKIFIAPP